MSKTIKRTSCFVAVLMAVLMVLALLPLTTKAAIAPVEISNATLQAARENPGGPVEGIEYVPELGGASYFEIQGYDGSYFLLDEDITLENEYFKFVATANEQDINFDLNGHTLKGVGYEGNPILVEASGGEFSDCGFYLFTTSEGGELYVQAGYAINSVGTTLFIGDVLDTYQVTINGGVLTADSAYFYNGVYNGTVVVAAVADAAAIIGGEFNSYVSLNCDVISITGGTFNAEVGLGEANQDSVVTIAGSPTDIVFKDLLSTFGATLINGGTYAGLRAYSDLEIMDGSFTTVYVDPSIEFMAENDGSETDDTQAQQAILRDAADIPVVIISGGQFQYSGAEGDDPFISPFYATGADVLIEGGTFVNAVGDDYFGNAAWISTVDGGSAIITGGKFVGGTNGYGVVTEGTGDFTVTGGSFMGSSGGLLIRTADDDSVDNIVLAGGEYEATSDKSSTVFDNLPPAGIVIEGSTALASADATAWFNALLAEGFEFSPALQAKNAGVLGDMFAGMYTQAKISVVEKAVVPDTPATPATGDSGYMPWAITLLASVGVALVVVTKVRRTKEEE